MRTGCDQLKGRLNPWHINIVSQGSAFCMLGETRDIKIERVGSFRLRGRPNAFAPAAAAA